MNNDIIQTRLNKDFVTESGNRFENAPIAYKTWGTLNDARDNVILICHALTGHAAADEWFPGLIGNQKLCNPENQFIICINVPGSCYGSLGPWSKDPKTGEPYRSKFPNLTIRDMVRFQQLLLDQLGILGIELVVGGSMGGMQALEFSIMDRRIRSACLIAMGMAHRPWAIGISEAQRAAIKADPKWNNGDYEYGDGPNQGIAAARMMAMITYRTPKNYDEKFGRKLQDETDTFQVESYLQYQGKKLAGRFDANTYITLTKAMDSHDISRGRGTFEQVLNRVEIPVQVIGVTSDHLYPLDEQEELVKRLPNGRLHVIESDYGHDAFLIEFEQLHNIIKPFKEIQSILTY
ncbi:homoserine O-acetyltransferase [Rhodohalobacter sp. SW132]|uniref:homoserine O-acetyltransferase MetX n=1 Tax=Rhodohalobacter sp. SW132 TaxID=2293433 RepID=UPI000E2255E4|nr:homoserine O-acetyltransferase [Rhodohalobacter sp. SW132]REL38106.1 homoserine O-acetyltransferase [Rhodohalobacter sp. SW132]